jgi:hypothetical protein
VTGRWLAVDARRTDRVDFLHYENPPAKEEPRDRR